MKKVRVRYAPSPTGILHIGNARTALFNYVYAKHFGGDFIIRIEDTDTLRNIEGGEESQLHSLSWLGIKWDEGPDIGGSHGPYRQLERLDLYIHYANILLEKGFAYKEYRENTDQYAIRFKVPKNVTYTFSDIVRGELTFQSKEVEDWIIIKENGIPTYNFAVVIDDHLMNITHILRGEEHITNTPKQMMVYQAFNWKIPTFGHMTIIVNEQKKKLSKRDQNVIQFIEEYEKRGYLPEAIFNFVTLLGWSPKTNEEILSPKEIIDSFDPNRLSKSPAMFDREKLAYINSRYIKMLKVEELAELAKSYFVNANIEIESDQWLYSIVSLLQDRLTNIAEIVDLYHAFFHDDFRLTDEVIEVLREFNSLPILKIFQQHLSNNDFEAETLEQAIKQTGIDAAVKGKPLFMSIRIATTSEMHGPSLPASLALLGKERVLERITQTIQLLRGEK
ncbi:MAG: glutamate--tRNA ligase [Acholeplasmataceae bacterium]